MSQIIFNTGRVLGLLAGAAVAVAWSFAMWVPTGGLTLSGMSFVVAFIMSSLGLLAMIAAWRSHTVVLFVVFVASFLPVGGYLMGTQHWLRWVGTVDLLFLLAGLLMWWSRRTTSKAVD